MFIYNLEKKHRVAETNEKYKMLHVKEKKQCVQLGPLSIHVYIKKYIGNSQHRQRVPKIIYIALAL